MIHSWATDKDDPTEQPRWGKVGKQKIEDAGTLSPDRMKTVDDEILEHTFKFIDKAKAGRQALLHLAEPDPDARHHPPLRQVREDADAGERLVHLRGGHGPARRHRRLGDEEAGQTWVSRTTRSSCSQPTTARRTSPGPTAARRRSPAARGRCSKEACASLASSAGRARYRPARSRTRSCRGSTGSRRSWRRRATRTSPESSSKASNSARRPTRSISTATIRGT